MKKQLALILSLLLVFASSVTAFADQADNTAMNDIQGTKYEKAVKTLAEKGILSGFEDGSFRPGEVITRAQACIAVVKVLGIEDKVLKGASESGFKDLSGYTWAKASINYAAANGIVAGYGNGAFKPGQAVSYAEITAMLMNALGYTAETLSGSWPNNYLNKANELGLFKLSDLDSSALDLSKGASRGDVALLLSTTWDKIEEKEETKLPDSEGEKEESASKTGVESSGKLKDFSGRAYGVILSIGNVSNKNGETVKQIEFLIGSNISYLNTDTKCKVPSPINFDGILYTLKMSDGIVKEIAADGNDLKAKHFKELTAGWGEVVSRENSMITILTADGTKKINIVNDASIYRATFSSGEIDGYKSATLSNITKGSLIRAYDLADDSSELANAVIVVEKKNASNII